MPSCVPLFHLFIYFPRKLFFPFFPSTNKSADGYDVMQISSQGDNMTSPQKKKKKINTENNEQETCQQKDTFLHLRCQQYIQRLHRAACVKAAILYLNAFIICFIHILNARRPHIVQPRCCRRASAGFHLAK